MDTIAMARTDSIGAALARSARRNGARVALTYEGREWSFAGLHRAAHRVARRLADLGMRPGDRIAAYGRNSDAYVLAWLGCAVGGFIHVPMNYALTGEELSYIVEQSGARMVLHDPNLAANLEGVRASGRVERFGTMLDGGTGDLDILAVAQDESAPTEVDTPVTAGDVVQLLYTSGTTAAPKGAMMTHGALLAEYQSCIHDCRITPRRCTSS